MIEIIEGNLFDTDAKFICHQVNCKMCIRDSIRTIGAVVVVKNNKMESIWDVDMSGTIYDPVVRALSTLIHESKVVDVFVSHFKKIGTDKNFEMINGKSHQWDHFYMELPMKFVFDSYRSVGEIQGEYRDVRNVFKRSLDEITIDSVETVLELINSNTCLLYTSRCV